MKQKDKQQMINKFRDMDISKSDIKKVRIRDWGFIYFVDVEFFEEKENKRK